MGQFNSFYGYCACGTYIGNDPCKKCAKEIKTETQKRKVKEVPKNDSR
jgi:hypothetical protein